MTAILIHVSVVLMREGSVLLVQERKAVNHGLWNLPGGHLEPGETVQDGARREAREETGLAVTLPFLLGIYTTLRPPNYHAIRYVFWADYGDGEAIAGDDILAARWFSPADLAALGDAQMVGQSSLRRILADAQNGSAYPLALLVEPDTTAEETKPGIKT